MKKLFKKSSSYFLIICLLITYLVLPNQALATPVAWSATSNPSGDLDAARAITSDSTGIYVAGYDSSVFGTWQWRIEKRSLTDGSLITSFGTNGVVTSNHGSESRIVAIARSSSGIYVAGYDNSPGGSDYQWRIEKRSLTNGSLISSFGTGGVVTSNPSVGNDQVNAIALDNTGIYVAGYDHSPGDNQWRIEKRSLTDGSLISSFGTGGVITNNPSTGSDSAWAVTLVSSGIYVAGFDNSPGGGDYQWRIEKRSLTDGSLISSFGTAGAVTSNPSPGDDEVNAIASDSTGIYVAGYDHSPGDNQWRIEKRSLTDGSLISSFGAGGVITNNPSTGSDVAWAVTSVSTGIYVVGYDNSPGGGNTQWRIEKRKLSDGSLITSFGTNGAYTSNFSTGDDETRAITLDSTGIYVAGYDYSLGGVDYQWRIEKYSDDTFLGTSLSLSAKPKSVKAGKRTALSGRLKDSNGQVLAGQTVKIYKRVLKKIKKKVKGKIKIIKKWVWKKVATSKTGSDGKYKSKQRLNKTTIYKAEFAGAFGHKVSSSKSVRVRVKR